MFKVITTLSMVLAAHLAQAQTPVEPFTKIDAGGNLKIILTKSDRHTVNFTHGSGNASAESVEGVLTIKTDPGREATLEISAPDVQAIRASRSFIKVEGGLSTQKVAIRLTDGATLGGNLDAQKITVSAKSGSTLWARLQSDSFTGNFSGKSRASLSGKSRFAKIDAENGSLCLARNLLSERASVRAVSESDMTVNTLGKISISVDETAKITCIGARTPSIADDTRVVLAH